LYAIGIFILFWFIAKKLA